MKKVMRYAALIACIMLVISVLSIGTVIPDDEAENEIELIVYRRGMELAHLHSSSEYSVLETYDEYILVRTDEENRDELKNDGYVVESLENRDYVGLHTHGFHVEDGEPEIPDDLEITEYPQDLQGYYIVQFIGPIRSEWKDQLERRGAVLHSFRPMYNFIAEMDAETRRSIEELDFVQWVGIYQPAYRFDPDIMDEDKELLLDVSLFDNVDSRSVAQEISRLGGEIKSNIRNTISLEIDSENIVEIANIHGINHITEGIEGHHVFNSDATWVSQTNEENNRKATDLGLTGKGELITVMDSGLFREHEAFHDENNEIGDDHRKIQDDYVPPGSDGDVDGGHQHGTHVTGTVLGESPPYGEYSNEDGNSFEARVIHQDTSSDGMSISIPDDMYNHGFGDPYDEGSRIHTNSWGARGGGEYTSESQEYDEFVWDHKDFNILFAAGNDGDSAQSMSPQASSKNIFSVGSVTNAPSQEDVSSFSSRGYTEDGRIKPTILHVGENLMSADDEDAEGYSSLDGTSMACPGIAGQLGQVRQYYRDGWYPSGSENPDDGFNPSNALVRATMINGAVEISGTGAYENDNRFPNGDQGFGRSMLDRALHFEGDDRQLIAYDSLDNGVELDTGDSWDMNFIVDDPSQELEITLAWTDYPGDAGADPTIVNDLDLEVSSPDGTRYVGNAYTGYNPGYSEPDPNSNPWDGQRDGEFDGLNVEENVLLLPDENGVESGSYEVTVTAHNVPQGTQPFALVVSGGITSETPGDPPEVELNRPDGGEAFEAGDIEAIEWTTEEGDDPIDSIHLSYSTDNGNSWHVIENDLEDTGTYDWIVPNEHSSNCLVNVQVVDEEYRSNDDQSSDVFEITGVPPDKPENLKVEHIGVQGNAVENHQFVDGYEPWELTREVDEGEAGWDDASYQEGGSIKVSAEQVGSGTSTEGSYWEQELIPLSNEIEVDGAFRRNIELEHGDCSVDQASVEISLYDTGTGWEQVIMDDDSSEGDTGWEEFETTTYDPVGQVDAVRISMDVEAQGHTEWGLIDHEALGELWVDHLSLSVEDGDLDHNLLTWDASPDDPNEVSHYNIYRSEDQDGPWDEPVDDVEAEGLEEYEFIDINKGEADDIYWWYVVRAVGENGIEEENEDAVQEPGDELKTMDIELYTDEQADGWNFVSFNLITEETELESILEDQEYGISGSYEKVMYYEYDSDEWMSYIPGRDEFNDDIQWDRTKGMWIRMVEDDTLSIEGNEPSETDITLNPGWNMVSYPSAETTEETLPTEVTRVGYFDATQDNNIAYVEVDEFEFEPGRGYYLYAEGETTWTVEY